MRYSENLHLNLPEDSDPLEISKLSENFETLDASVSSIRAPGTKIGDIVYSMQNLEEQSNGVWIACDHRAVLVSEYPDLCALPSINSSINTTPTAYPGNTVSVSLGNPGLNLRVGDRYIFASSYTNDNWITTSSVFDLVENRFIGSGSGSGFYIDDDIFASGSSGSSGGYSFYRIENGQLSSAFKPTGVGLAHNKLFKFKDKYIFLSHSASKLAEPVYTVNWVYVHDMLSKSPGALKNSTYILEPGFALYSNTGIYCVEDGPMSLDIPFRSPVIVWQDELYAVGAIQNLADTNEQYLVLLKSDDAITWTQTSVKLAIPSNFYSYMTYALGVVNSELYIMTSHTIRDSDVYTHTLCVRRYNTDLELLDESSINGFHVQYNTTGVYMQDEYLYAYGKYNRTLDKGEGSMECMKINLKTKEFSQFYLPSWIYQDLSRQNRETFTTIHSTLFGPEVKISVRGSLASNSYGSSGYRSISRYDYERGRLIQSSNSNDSVPSALIQPTGLEVQYKMLYNYPYNSKYILTSMGSNNPLGAIDILQQTRLLPYIRNGYIKALNEGDVE